jgi:hypothetical protein
MSKPGSTVDLEVVHRNGNKAVVKAKLGELPADSGVRVRPAAKQRRPQHQWP